MKSDVDDDKDRCLYKYDIELVLCVHHLNEIGPLILIPQSIYNVLHHMVFTKYNLHDFYCVNINETVNEYQKAVKSKCPTRILLFMEFGIIQKV